MGCDPKGWSYRDRSLREYVNYRDETITLVDSSMITRHRGNAAMCRATHTCRLTLRTARCRPLLSCLPPLPFAVAPGSGGPAALCC